jgi:hypothetical protein
VSYGAEGVIRMRPGYPKSRAAISDFTDLPAPILGAVRDRKRVPAPFKYRHDGIEIRLHTARLAESIVDD